mmetsp:Transcript_34506/g.83456  ORF Transcript_34506/g.83456 Transcript_34506/m.83456 type:complete len:355 (-) Transcript_34506:57-1121(-)|eukprot:CAMPEP_0114523014 /NCGR_PEP_ID=MMETSP0109-20121206/21061_1 /TAXON_ID=29199 /ORGANISM="Chlorarachnion reptans, Strain CCCM449" /LENGTH=354 /DNA_ID=CAMNT_0001704293 /DNA_START=131 /DNA_END=1195 /DNA_ORIENTATION=+
MSDALETLRDNIRSLVLGGTKDVPRVSAKSLTAIKFHREYVGKNAPVIITDALEHWGALGLWDDENTKGDIGEQNIKNYQKRNLAYLSAKLKGQKISVDFTPDGRGDSVDEQGKYFVIPHKEEMEFASFAKLMTNPNHKQVAYCQHQNSNFTTEFKTISDDIKPLDFAQEAFGMSPDAVNIWIGDERSVSSLHRDPYENIYCVVKGTKKFTLLPPTDGPYLQEQPFPCKRYKMTEANQIGRDNVDVAWSLEDVMQSNESKRVQMVPWIPVDPDDPERISKNAKCLLGSRPEKLSPVRCEVRKGEVLYLPALWFHQVGQIGLTIAVNFWYDMQFGTRWALLQYLEERERKGKPND